MPEAQKNDYLTSILSIPNNKEDTTDQIINATKYIENIPIAGTTNIPP